jgi:hypothetical protein
MVNKAFPDLYIAPVRPFIPTDVQTQILHHEVAETSAVTKSPASRAPARR